MVTGRDYLVSTASRGVSGETWWSVATTVARRRASLVWLWRLVRWWTDAPGRLPRTRAGGRMHNAVLPEFD